MQTSKKSYFLLSLILFFTTTSSKAIHQCGNIELQTPFITRNSSLNRMIKCESQKLYFPTSIGLFPISDIDYATKTFTISHPFFSCSHHYVSPALLSAGFPSPPQPNSLLLFNCSHKRHPVSSSFIKNCTNILHDIKLDGPNSCLLVEDVQKLHTDFHPKDLSCSHYRRVYRSRSIREEEYEGVELGTRISFDIPDHVPDICNECYKPNGNCGVGLRCVCHAKECKDKVISAGSSIGISFEIPLFSVIFLINFWII